MSTFTIERKSSFLILWLAMIIVMLSLGDEAHAALQCYDCHGARSGQDIRPKDGPAVYRNPTSGSFQGNHGTHMGPGATPAACAKCHPGSAEYTASHRDGLIKVSANLNSSVAANPAIYKNSTTAWPQTSTPSPGTCNNVNCHFEKSVTPQWGGANFSAPGDCSQCHGAPPADGQHPKTSGSDTKHGAYYGTTSSCNKCHPDHLSKSNPFQHATSVTKRPLALSFVPASVNVVGRYSSNLGSSHLNFPNYLDRLSGVRDGACTDIYCHSDGNGGPPNTTKVTWSGGMTTNTCYACHKGRASDSTQANCDAIQGHFSSIPDTTIGVCNPDLTMTSNGHHRLAGPQWIRKYPCNYCHYKTIAADGTLSNISSMAAHVNYKKDVVMAPQWNIVGRPVASYNPVTKTCADLYCHSDGTTNPEEVRLFEWDRNKKAECNDCHGHPTGSCANAKCHDGKTHLDDNKFWPVKTGWGAGNEWMGSMPMFKNEGAGTPRANSHPRHAQSNFTCDSCHALTIVTGSNGSGCIAAGCHQTGQVLSGVMSEVSHLNAQYHVNKTKDVLFRSDIGGSYNKDTKTCSGTACHSNGADPVWGGSVNNTMTCFNCHGTSGADLDEYGGFGNKIQARINTTQWYSMGHGRYSTSGRYPGSGNPAANFPSSNPCWYCHDNNVLHGYSSNRFRLRLHPQYERRFEKECVYCHMQGQDVECLACHDVPLVNGKAESLAPQLRNINYSTSTMNIVWANKSTVRYRSDNQPAPRPDHRGYTGSCMDQTNNIPCHYVDSSSYATSRRDGRLHNSGAGFWTQAQKSDIKNQYMMMGVCLQCHDDDSGGQCVSCHLPPSDNLTKYDLGFDPKLENTRLVKPKKARASSSHFGYKHWRSYEKTGVWPGGKFCWNCHDPHGDANIYMIHDKVALTTDGTFGIPQTMAPVSFTRKQSGLDYAKTSAPYNGICNVCHSPASKHFTAASGDGHNSSRVCTTCHEHRFADSHADGAACNGCHTKKKPVPKHNAFGLPADCTKCHGGVIGKRMDIMGQMRSNSHHVQGVEVTNKKCYQCHWESTVYGTIDNVYHEGYNFLQYTSVKAAKVDLVIYGPGYRPTVYRTPVNGNYSTAAGRATVVQFLASNISFGIVSTERKEAAKVSNHCLGCHNDENNDNATIFGDCKTPRQYAWDRSSIKARYSQAGTTAWGKYGTNGKSTVTKAFSAHGNAKGNKGGWSTKSGYDGAIPNTRNGKYAVECYDCHSSHGSKVVGISSSYITYNGTKNGANLKETQAGKGGYQMTYKASANTKTTTINTYNAGAGQCYDCHLTRNKGVTPWGYFETFGAISSIKGYTDTDRFDNGYNGQLRTAYKDHPVQGGHMKRSGNPLNPDPTLKAETQIDHLCTPCHDPHGISPNLGANQQYAVPLLKGTWMTSPYKEDMPIVEPSTGNRGSRYVAPPPAPIPNIDQNTPFGGTGFISQDESQFAGLCLQCHPKSTLATDFSSKTYCSDPQYNSDKVRCQASGATWTENAWKSKERVHEAVKGWKTSNPTVKHQFTCSKCHTPHVTTLPRLMQTNCLDYQHRGQGPSGGYPGHYQGSRNAGGFPQGKNGVNMQNCHPTGAAWPDNYWNTKTKWPQ